MDRCGVALIFVLSYPSAFIKLGWYYPDYFTVFFFFWCSIDIVFNSWIITRRLDVLCLFNLLIIDKH